MVTTAQRLTALEQAVAALKQADANLSARIGAEVTNRATAVTVLDTRLKVVEAHTHGVPEPEPSPVPVLSDLPGWKLAFADEFDTPIARGQWHDPAAPTIRGAYQSRDRRYLINGPWKDTYNKGVYNAANFEVADGKLDLLIRTVNGVPQIGGFKPLPTGCDPQTAGLQGPIRTLLVARADRMPGYKGVPNMLWPTVPPPVINGVVKPSDWSKYIGGEVDGPEGDFDGTDVAGFMHWPNVLVNGVPQTPDQTWVPYPAGTRWDDWHEYVTEFVPATSLRYFLDGRLVRELVEHVPFVAAPYGYRVNHQFETELVSTMPDPAVTGHVQIERLGVWVAA